MPEAETEASPRCGWRVAGACGDFLEEASLCDTVLPPLSYTAFQFGEQNSTPGCPHVIWVQLELAVSPTQPPPYTQGTLRARIL